MKNVMAQEVEERIKDERKARAARFALETKAKLQKAIQRKKLRQDRLKNLKESSSPSDSDSSSSDESESSRNQSANSLPRT